MQTDRFVKQVRQDETIPVASLHEIATSAPWCWLPRNDSAPFWILPLDFARGPEHVEGDLGSWIDLFHSRQIIRVPTVWPNSFTLKPQKGDLSAKILSNRFSRFRQKRLVWNGGPGRMRGCEMDEATLDRMIEQRMEVLQEKVIIQLEEKAQMWIEEVCKKRMETLRSTVRRQVEKEAAEWVDKELNKRMEDLKR